MRKIQITTKGIKKSLKKFTYLQSIAEYIWNGFDAKATQVEVQTVHSELDAITEIQITDNGYGISIMELESKFTPFFESEKQVDPAVRLRNAQSATHGKNGIGRLTFHRFCSEAEWITTYQDGAINRKYKISVKEDSLDSYGIDEPETVESEAGTKVILKGITYRDINMTEIKKFLCKEFGWFLELHADKEFAIKINGERLDYSMIIGEIEYMNLRYNPTNAEFNVKYVRWDEKMNQEYSKYYFIDSEGNEKQKINTSLNNKGDSFYHSIYIQSNVFNQFDFGEVIEGQQLLFGYSRDSEEYKFLMESLNKYLREKRKPFLIKYTDVIIEDFKAVKAFPEYGKNSWDEARREELENLIREMYQVEPRIFSKLNVEQKKTFVRFLDLIMDAGEQERLFDILAGIVELNNYERAELADLLKTSRLSNIVKTIRLVQDRFKAVSDLQQIVYNEELMANEVNHVQKFIEKHYWIFGEQYHLVTAAEPKFEEALRRYVHLLTGDLIEGHIDHPDKRKEMDIFMVRWDKQIDVVRNIVVELKHPSIGLGKKQFDQVVNYLQVILNQEEFNSSQMQWEFILVGNKLDSTGYIEQLIENAANHGESSRGLVFKTGKYKVYIKTWADVFTEFEIKHKFLEEKLQLERARLSERYGHAGEIIDKLEANSASMPEEYVIQRN
ncbi:ATP-binding protein [Brevibacillus brevis]|uniref:ATP-binding protein n=1 Tax=Brevibacillus brevis TaxID=1393 RepID=UPI001643C9E4|nr:ATP-binding protein [Brevibacillus brevis]